MGVGAGGASAGAPLRAAGLEDRAAADLPFVILGFHSDNGSEFVNYATEELLREFEVQFTRSRARRSNDNGLVESKNASVVRKQFGYGHIPVDFYSDINGFTAGVLAEHINFHRRAGSRN